MPEVAIRATLAKFEPPTLEEGFDTLWQVAPDAAGTGFEVLPWPLPPGHQDHQGGDTP